MQPRRSRALANLGFELSFNIMISTPPDCCLSLSLSQSLCLSQHMYLYIDSHMCVHVYVCLFVCMYACTYVRMYVRVCISVIAHRDQAPQTKNLVAFISFSDSRCTRIASTSPTTPARSSYRTIVDLGLQSHIWYGVGGLHCQSCTIIVASGKR